MRHVYLVTALIVVLAVTVLGFRGTRFTHPPADVFPEWLFPGMKRQPKPRTMGASTFFADGRADRAPVPGTVASSYGPAAEEFRGDDALYLGKASDGSWIKGFPSAVKVDASFLARGKDRYQIYCTPCHGLVGDGNGITKQYGMGVTPSYHTDAIRNMAEGQIFHTITNGKMPGNMFPYGDKLSPRDRWAVVAYVRALQRASNGTKADVPAEHLSELGLK
jgi:mono/diheme cytochrome c family protein